MSYFMVITGTLVNLGLSLLPGPFAWVSALFFFGGLFALSAMASWDTMEYFFGETES